MIERHLCPVPYEKLKTLFIGAYALCGARAATQFPHWNERSSINLSPFIGVPGDELCLNCRVELDHILELGLADIATVDLYPGRSFPFVFWKEDVALGGQVQLKPLAMFEGAVAPWPQHNFWSDPPWENNPRRRFGVPVSRLDGRRG